MTQPAAATRASNLSRREAATICDMPISAVDKAIEQKAIRTVRSGRDVSIPVREVAPLLVMRRIGISLPVKTKRQIRAWLTASVGDAPSPREFAITDALVVRCTQEVLDTVKNAAEYAERRDAFITTDPAIKGGDAVISGTRLTTRAVLARLQGGDSMDDLVADYPYIPREALETAALYAASNPPRGRPVRPRSPALA